MKAVSLTLAAISGAGFLFHNQLQSLVGQRTQGLSGSARSHQAPEGVYYLRTAYNFAGSGVTAHWSAGQELRTATDMLATNGMVTLTDGRNTTVVPKTVVTRDMDEAAALRQLGSSGQVAEQLQTAAFPPSAAVPQANPERLVAGRFHETTLDAPTVRTNLPENIVSTAGAPFVYPVYNTTVINQTARPVIRREIIVQPPPQQRSVQQPRSSAPASGARNY